MVRTRKDYTECGNPEPDWQTSHVLPHLKFLPPTPQMWVYNKEQLQKLGPRKGTMESGGLRVPEYKGREKWENVMGGFIRGEEMGSVQKKAGGVENNTKVVWLGLKDS